MTGRIAAELLCRKEVYAIVGAAIAVHRELGPGFLEAVYQEALERELHARGIPFEAQARLHIQYKGQPLLQIYKADVICYRTVLLELKAADCLTGVDDAQVLNYLKATGLRVGLLINFGGTGKLEWKRFVL